MPLMFVTLDVSMLSGWLNADASCRVELRRVHKDLVAGRETGGCWGDARREQRARETRLDSGGDEHTLNILLMVMTLDVLRLSVWSNADAICRVNLEHVKRPGCKARRAPETGESGATCGV